MGRRQGGPSRTGTKRARILKRYVTDEQRSRRPIFHRNPLGRGQLAVFPPPRRILTYQCIAKIIAIEPTDPNREKLNLGGGITLEYVEAKFRLEPPVEGPREVRFKEPHKIWGVTSETGRLWQRQEGEPPTYLVEHGIFTASLNRHPELVVGKGFVVLLPDDSR